MEGEGEGRSFLPPEPAGGEPDLGEAPTRELSSADAGPQSPPAAQSHGQAPPPQSWSRPPAAEGPDNGSAVAGFTLSLVGGGLLLITLGLSSVVSVVCSALGVFYSKRGRDRVDRGETPKHRGLAQAGFVIGIVSLVLSVLATLAYAAVLALVIGSEDFREEFKRELERELDQQNATVHLAVVVVVGHLARSGLSLIA